MGAALTESGLGVEGHEITELAAKAQIDLIIMSTHGRTELAQAFLGVAELGSSNTLRQCGYHGFDARMLVALRVEQRHCPAGRTGYAA